MSFVCVICSKCSMDEHKESLLRISGIYGTILINLIHRTYKKYFLIVFIKFEENLEVFLKKKISNNDQIVLVLNLSDNNILFI